MPKDKPVKKIKIIKNGPYKVSGGIPLTEKSIIPDGKKYKYRQEKEFSPGGDYILCRCGHTKTPPFCDASHMKAGFHGEETASMEKYNLRVRRQAGPDLTLLDDDRCAFARFCHRDEGTAWELTGRSDVAHLRDEAIIAASECPAGRLTAVDRDNNPIEIDYSPSIDVLQDPSIGVSGPLFVKGGIPVESAGGKQYEARNRVALCRCGKSCNKPFCDASHVTFNFNDGNLDTD